MTPLTPGRLFVLQLARSAAARKAALESIRPLPRGGFQVRVGGRVRGSNVKCCTRREAEQVVAAHYDAALMTKIKEATTRAATLAAIHTGAEA